MTYLITLEGPDSFVNHPDVFDKVGLFVESVLAVVADEGTLVQVDGT